MISFTVLVIAASVLVQTYGFWIRPQLDGRIVGGQNAHIADHPYQLSLQYFRTHFCGASLIRGNLALTAAHCTEAYSNNLNIRAGSSYTDNGGEISDVTIVNKHPQYNPGTTDYDVSVLNLAEHILRASSINLQPVGEDPPYGALAVVTGWGALYQGGPSPFQLQKVQVNHISETDCNAVYDIITARMTCYSAPGKDSCQGDSGGPLAYDYKQIGIVSWGFGCAVRGYPGVYARISNREINSFIRQNMQKIV